MNGLKGITVNTPPEAEPHIYAEDDAAIYQSILGADGVTTIGQQCKATTLSNNKVRISDGVVIVGGHIARIPYGEYVDCEIANGQSGQKRNDIIIAKIVSTGTGGIDTMTCEVKQGVAGVSATDPALTQDDIYNSGKIREIPLYRVKIEGLSIVAVEKLFKSIPSIPELEKIITDLNSKINIKKFSAVEIGVNSPIWKVIFSNVYKQNGMVHFMAQAYTTETTVANASYTVFNLPEELKPLHNYGVTAIASDANGNNACACYSHLGQSGDLTIKIPNNTCKYVLFNAIWFGK